MRSARARRATAEFGRDELETVWTAGMHVKFDGAADSGEPARVVDGLVTEDVQLAHLHIGRWQARQVLRPRRGGVRGHVGPAGGVTEQGVPAGVVVVGGPDG